jgi:hypothetical protein
LLQRLVHQRFSKSPKFRLRGNPTTCPHDLFRRDDDPKARASQAHPEFADVSRIVVNRKQNAATEAAALIIPAVGNNKLRHETLQNFMLANDSVTVAIENPIWLTEDDIGALERKYRIELARRAGNAPRVITGHIDFLQVRNGAVQILDYKPDAPTNKPIAQSRSTPSRSRVGSPVSNSSTSSVPGSMSTNIVSSSRERFSPDNRWGSIEPNPDYSARRSGIPTSLDFRAAGST